MADIVDDFLTRLQQHVPDLPINTRLNLERDIRSEHGGTRAGDVAKGINGLSKSTRTFIVSMGLRHQKPMPEIFSAAGISRRTGYRMLGSK